MIAYIREDLKRMDDNINANFDKLRDEIQQLRKDQGADYHTQRQTKTLTDRTAPVVTGGVFCIPDLGIGYGRCCRSPQGDYLGLVAQTWYA